MSIDFSYPTATNVHGSHRAQASFVDNSDPQAVRQAEKASWGEDGFGVGDFLDMINPLQHIPGVSTAYRAITGDEISQGARLLGGGIFGGVVGMAAAGANVVAAQATGADMEGHALGFLSAQQERALQQHITSTTSPTEKATAAPAALMPEIASLSAPADLRPVSAKHNEQTQGLPKSAAEMTSAIDRYRALSWQHVNPASTSLTS